MAALMPFPHQLSLNNQDRLTLHPEDIRSLPLVPSQGPALRSDREPVRARWSGVLPGVFVPRKECIPVQSTLESGGGRSTFVSLFLRSPLYWKITGHGVYSFLPKNKQFLLKINGGSCFPVLSSPKSVRVLLLGRIWDREAAVEDTRRVKAGMGREEG